MLDQIIALIANLPSASSLAFAQETQQAVMIATPDELQRCAAYFADIASTHSLPWLGWIITMIPMIYFALTKKNIPDLLRDAGKKRGRGE